MTWVRARGLRPAGRVSLLVIASLATGTPTFGSSRPSEPQSGSAVVVVVLDPSGAIVPGATVTLSRGGDPASAAVGSGLTNARGEMAFRDLTPGDYAVSAEIAGFPSFRPMRFRVPVRGERLVLKLGLPRLTESVSVQSADPLGEFGRHPFTRTLTPLEIAQLPDDPAAFEQVLRQMAGPNATITVDGFRRSSLPPKSAIALIIIKWADLSAETHAQGSVSVEIITKPGNSTMEGQVTLALQPAAWAADDAFSDRAGATNDGLGLSLSGPIWKGRTSYLAYVRASRTRDPSSVTADLPGGGPVPQGAEAIWSRVDADWQVSHQFGRAAFLRVGGTVQRQVGDHLGVGGLDLPERGVSSRTAEDTLRVSLFAGRDAKLFNHLRAWLRLASSETVPVSNAPAILVSGAFNAGGAQRRGSRERSDWAVEDDLDLAVGIHAMRLGAAFEQQTLASAEWFNDGGTFYFSSEQGFVQGLPVLFTIRRGDPTLRYGLRRGAAYFQDDMRLRDAVTLGCGVRWEWQTAIAGRWYPTPRFRVSWTPTRARSTAIKGGLGWYNDWVEAELIGQVQSVDGEHQSDLLITNPGFPNPGSDSGTEVTPSRRQFAPGLHLPLVRRFSLGVEHKLKGTTWRVTVDRTSSGTGLRARNLNSPLPDGTRPVPTLGNIVEVDAARWSRTSGVRVEMDATVPPRVLVKAQYDLRSVRDDADGPLSLPANSRVPSADRGPGTNDIRHRLGVFLFSPITSALTATAFFMCASGAPYNVTTGSDDNADGVVNDRPPGVTRNSRRGSPYAALDVRLIWRFFGGPRTQDGGSSRTQRSLSAYVSVQNALNRVNPSAYVGVVGSPLFGQAIAAGPMRRVELGITAGF